MKLKVVFFSVLVVTVVLVAWQYLIYRHAGLSCAGDWSYNTTCRRGTYCRSLGQGPLAGGTCQPYLAPLFDLSILNKSSQKPEGAVPSPKPEDKKNPEPIFCGGIAGMNCPAGYTCQLDGKYPDAGGTCVGSSNQASPSYTCPKTEWVNCMPILTPEAQKSCTKEYLDWAINNCLGFKGAAY